MKLKNQHKDQVIELSEEYRNLLLDIPEELRSLATEYVMNFMSAMMKSSYVVAAQWLNLIPLSLFSGQITLGGRKAILDLYNRAMNDLAEAERAEHERNQRKGLQEKLHWQLWRTQQWVFNLLRIET
jgi:hypothetical protein